MSSINVGAEQSDQEKVDAIHTGMIDLIAERDSLKQQLAEALAKIDHLMLEYCPEDMGSKQIENWRAHQRVVESDLDEQLRRT